MYRCYEIDGVKYSFSDKDGTILVADVLKDGADINIPDEIDRKFRKANCTRVFIARVQKQDDWRNDNAQFFIYL